MIGGFAEVVLRRKRGPSDIELASTRTHEHHSQGHPPMNLQDRLSKALFDNDPKPAIWSPLVTKPLTIFTESKLLEMEPTFLRPVLEYLHISTEGSRAESVIVLVEAVARLLKENGDRNLSIHSLLRKLYEAFNGAKPPFNVAPELCQGIFALFGVLTMLYKAGYPMKSELLYPSEPDVERMSGAKRRTAVAGRPIGSIIRAFGEFTPYIEKYPTDGDEAEEKDTGWKTDPPDAVDLYVSTLNAYVLVKIGKVKIKWSDYLGAHLSFDMYSRTLTLFRFASFCGLNYPLAEESSFFDCIMDNHHNNRRNIKAGNKSMHREVLLSYRLLFRQDNSSRALFNNQEIKEVSAGGLVDPLLVQLCGQKQQIGDILGDETLIEQDFYDNVIEFPFYGPELVRLQKYARSRKPRRYLDVWRDTRDPSQWLTLWLLVIIGGLSVLFSFLQTAASVIQAVRAFA